MKKKCPRCGKEEMRVWALISADGMFLQCKTCNWTSKDMPWTKKAKAEWKRLNTKRIEHEKRGEQTWQQDLQ